MVVEDRKAWLDQHDPMCKCGHRFTAHDLTLVPPAGSKQPTTKKCLYCACDNFVAEGK